MPQSQLTIGLLKPGAFSNLVAPHLASWGQHDVTVNGAYIGSLYIPKTSRGPTRWAAWFDEADTNPTSKLVQMLQSALLHVQVDDRDFVLPFGMSGRHAIPLEALEEHFGRNVTLNTVHPDKLRVIDNVRVEAEARHSRVQLGRSGTFLAFALDPDQDLVRSIGGEPRDPSFGARVHGATYLALTSDTMPSSLKSKLKACLLLSESDAYKKDFDYLDALSPVRDPSRIAELSALVANRVASDDAPGQAWLAIPEIIDWSSDLRGFAFTRSPKSDQDVFPDVFIHRFRKHLGHRTIDPKLLKSRYVYLLRTDGHAAQKWTVFHCLYAEIEQSGVVFVLTEGKWYAVERALVDRVNKFVKKLPECSVDVATWGVSMDEAAFNDATAKHDPAKRHNLDGKPVVFGGPNQKIEVCDVLCEGRVLIHAKKYKSSKPLSHLFAQGAHSAELLLDGDFRRAARAKFPFLPKQWTAQGREVAFVVGSHSTKDLMLPFFSRVTLRAVAQRLQRLGYVVSLKRVSIGSA